jgi:hypothetical protein
LLSSKNAVPRKVVPTPFTQGNVTKRINRIPTKRLITFSDSSKQKEKQEVLKSFLIT